MFLSVLLALRMPPLRAASMLTISSAHPLFAYALSPACQARGVYGAAGLQILLTRKVLPVMVLHPGVGHHLIRAIKGELQIKQACHHAWRQSGGARS